MAKYNKTSQSLDPYQWQAIPFPSNILREVSGVKNPSAYRRATRESEAQQASGFLTVYVAREDRGRWHLSISHHSLLSDSKGVFIPGRLPTWDEIKDARYRFLPDDVNMAIFLPPKSQYIDEHPTTMHLWEVTVREETGSGKSGDAVSLQGVNRIGKKTNRANR